VQRAQAVPIVISIARPYRRRQNGTEGLMWVGPKGPVRLAAEPVHAWASP
jgi:hypothetical protein